MGLFKRFFGSKMEDTSDTHTNKVPWIVLTSLEQLDTIVENSHSKPVAIYKHSTTCGISRMVFQNIERNYDIPTDVLDIYYLDLKAYRDISNEVAARFQVWHESPQLIVIKNGDTTYHSSHGTINVPSLKAQLKDAGKNS